MIIETCSYPRAAVIGNPSDGYNGKTIAFVFSNFIAKVKIYETPEIEIKPQRLDGSNFKSIDELVDAVNYAGYYGGMRLLKAAIKVFYDYCQKENILLDKRNFTICYKSTIPLRLGLAGSSAIITACMNALCKFFQVDIPKPILANLVLSVETVELGISAGLQDRVAQAYNTPVFMDFNKEVMKQQSYGNYEKLDHTKFPPFYIAYRNSLSEGTEVVHNDLAARFKKSKPEVPSAISKWAQITEDFKFALDAGDYKTMSQLINENFDLRKNTINISQGNIDMVELARSVGASAKFTGSGGAIIGTYKNEKMFNKLSALFSQHNIEIFKPEIVTTSND